MNDPSNPLQSALIGLGRPRPATRRLLEGRGRYVDDLALPRMLHGAFVRSPHGRARIAGIDIAAARALRDVHRIIVGADLIDVVAGWRGNSKAFPGLNSPLQRALAIDQAVFQGEPVALVLAASRAIAEDAAALVEVDWVEELASADIETVASGPPIHPELRSNIGFHTTLGTTGTAAVFANAAHVLSEKFRFGRHTGVTLEPRGLIADYDSAEGLLTLHHSHQVPNQIQQHFGDFLGIGEHRIRVVCPDVGGGFGIKLHLYPDELAIAAAAILTGRPVKWIADRIEALASDIHAREHIVDAAIALDSDGNILGFRVHDLCGMGAYSIYPRSSPVEAIGAVRAIGAPYRFDHFEGVIDAVFQNRPPTGMYRAVGFPIACAVTERLIDLAARARGEDPVGFRRRNYMRPADMPCTNPAGSRLFDLSHEACLDKLLLMMDYPALQAERDRLRVAGVVRGIGIAAFVEMTATGVEVYGAAEVPIIAMDSVTLKIEPSGGVRCLASITEQGQGTTAGIAQIVAASLGVPLDDVTVVTGDTAAVPAGGGAWASRGIPIGGEAAWEAGLRLKHKVLALAGRLLQCAPADLDLREGIVVDRSDARARMTLAELARLVYLRSHQLPPDVPLAFALTHQHRRTSNAFIPTNGVQASYLEVDVETGEVQLLRHWCVEDCGRIINPLLVDEQIRGGIVQGIGAALFEKCRYDERGQLLSGTMADYLVPMAADLPDIGLAHVETLYSGSALGAKGAGEAGTCAASAVILNAVNDALAPFGASVSELPITPGVILHALGKLSG